MQLWFARGSEVTIREQLVTQVVLGILSDDLVPGQRLPSTRELARRFRLRRMKSRSATTQDVLSIADG
jgi:DNA-binding transcriptional regulator YhcF (GntR family)